MGVKDLSSCNEYVTARRGRGKKASEKLRAATRSLGYGMTHDRLFMVPRAKNAHHSARKDAMEIASLGR